MTYNLVFITFGCNSGVILEFMIQNRGAKC